MEGGRSDSDGDWEDSEPHSLAFTSDQEEPVLHGGESGDPRGSQGRKLTRAQGEEALVTLQTEAYLAVLEAFKAQSPDVTWERDRVLCALRMALNITTEQDCVLINKCIATQETPGLSGKGFDSGVCLDAPVHLSAIDPSGEPSGSFEHNVDIPSPASQVMAIAGPQVETAAVEASPKVKVVRKWMRLGSMKGVSEVEEDFASPGSSKYSGQEGAPRNPLKRGLPGDTGSTSPLTLGVHQLLPEDEDLNQPLSAVGVGGGAIHLTSTTRLGAPSEPAAAIVGPRRRGRPAKCRLSNGNLTLSIAPPPPPVDLPTVGLGRGARQHTGVAKRSLPPAAQARQKGKVLESSDPSNPVGVAKTRLPPAVGAAQARQKGKVLESSDPSSPGAGVAKRNLPPANGASQARQKCKGLERSAPNSPVPARRRGRPCKK